MRELQELTASALGEIRTHNHLIRSQVLYPLSYEGGAMNNETMNNETMNNDKIVHCSFVIVHFSRVPDGT